jgi:hypothetical protein
MSLMGKKMTAAQALEGKFSSDGLVAMAGDEGGSVEMALARSLAERLDEGQARRAWTRVDETEPLVLPLRRPSAPSGRIAQARRFDLSRLRALKMASRRPMLADG